MKDKRVLFVSSEVVPYLPENDISTLSFEVPKMINSTGGQTRIFMPRFGNINERRHQLHEVIRLSGLNLVVNDLDMPLIIKVASIPKERMQVYFIDNEDYFKRKAMYSDEDGQLFEDNDERAIFFAKGVIETVKKLNWAPDIIHINGWMASLLPLYLKNYYGNEPLFKNSKIVTSVYQNNFEGELDKDLDKKIMFDGIDEDKVELIDTPNYNNLIKLSIKYSDGIVIGSDHISDELKTFVESIDIPKLDFHALEEFAQPYQEFYIKDILNEEIE
ncbi:glycogen/starch synthase [Mesohalobacter halotolerans]|jgi:starch synthase|uniref:starch synthase n=1 Tax=Mesohalobacter halotolerans TaxID=1883405 RepID=A0A4U5TT88_9FLAO|nr:glycogen/starch synthase [Mesohalobacter halotolerans]MBS3739386.1 glycogen/starch synthase [Psychroflexus sp.]NBC57569.1 glycogen synthase [Bacteroidota bacterium]TKS57577.1 glycogen synthase [Mesohalobacter halotolerans]